MIQKNKKIKKTKHAQKKFFRHEREKTSKEGGRELGEQGGEDYKNHELCYKQMGGREIVWLAGKQ